MGSTMEKGHSRWNLSACSRSTESNTMNDICGTDDERRQPEFRPFRAREPPWLSAESIKR
jgi:hypothetical protein